MICMTLLSIAVSSLAGLHAVLHWSQIPAMHEYASTLRSSHAARSAFSRESQCRVCNVAAETRGK